MAHHLVNGLKLQLKYIYKFFNLILLMLYFFKNLIFIQEAWANTLVCAELVCLFFVGEVVGRGTLIGYDVSRVQPKFPFF